MQQLALNEKRWNLFMNEKSKGFLKFTCSLNIDIYNNIHTVLQQ